MYGKIKEKEEYLKFKLESFSFFLLFLLFGFVLKYTTKSKAKQKPKKLKKGVEKAFRF
jgi:hypothetical protein